MRIEIFLYMGVAVASQVAPFLLGSHRLVTGLQDELSGPPLEKHDPSSVTNMVKKLVTACSSDVYLLVNVPGLKAGDMVERKKLTWPHLRHYIHMASSLVALPWMEGVLDMDFLEAYIVRTCKAEALRSFGDVDQYIDTRTRVIRYDADPLPQENDKEARDAALREVDDAIRRILRISPSPHYTILVTSSELDTFHPVPQAAVDASPEFFQLFNDIVTHSTRDEEWERNSFMYKDVEPYWNTDQDPMSNYLRKKQADEIHLLDPRLWEQNERLIMTVLLMALSLVLFQSVSLMSWFRRKCEAWKRSRVERID